jgi:hypothetical protein
MPTLCPDGVSFLHDKRIALRQLHDQQIPGKYAAMLPPSTAGGEEKPEISECEVVWSF